MKKPLWAKALEIIEKISSVGQSTDPKRDWEESQIAVCEIYKIVHWVRAPKCRKNHPGWGDWAAPAKKSNGGEDGR